MDPITLEFLILAFLDSCISFYIGTVYGPNKAKRLTIDEFKDPKTAEQVQKALNMPTRTDMADLRLDLEKRQEAAELNMAGLVGRLEAAVAHVKLDPTIQLSVKTEDELVRQVRTVARQEIKAAMGPLLEEARQLLGGDRGPPNDQDAQALLMDAEFKAWLGEAAQVYRIPSFMVEWAYQVGREIALPVLTERFNLPMGEGVSR